MADATNPLTHPETVEWPPKTMDAAKTTHPTAEQQYYADGKHGKPDEGP